jgi:replicative DNA helicase
VTNSSYPDEADMQRDGTLPEDPLVGTKVVAAKVPRVLTVQQLLTSSRERAFMRRDDTGLLTTGHYRLDDITGGIRPGFSWLFGADTSFGKSTWLVSVADENIKRKKRVLIVSSEDPEEIYGDRLMVRRARVSAKGHRDRRLTPDEMQRVLDVEQAGEPSPVYVDACRWPVEELASHLEKIITEQKIDLVAFDYIQEFKSSKRWQDERVKFREIASILRHVGKRLKVASILFSQLTLDADTKIPTRRNIRECRDIANASEVILIGFEPDQDITDKNKLVVVNAGTKCVLVDKVKNGPRGAKVPLDWSPEHACFNEVKDPEQERLDQESAKYSEFGSFAEDPRYP